MSPGKTSAWWDTSAAKTLQDGSVAAGRACLLAIRIVEHRPEADEDAVAKSPDGLDVAV